MQQSIATDDAIGRTCSLSDGRAGNRRQAVALAQALGVSAHELVLQPRAPWRWVAPRRLPLSARAFGPAFAQLVERPPDLAIGCGRQAALATRVLRDRGARVVQILDPRLPPRHWDLVIAPEHDGLRGENVISMLGSLNPVDDLWLAAARQKFSQLAELPRPRTVVLLGGDRAHARFDPLAFEALATRVLASSQRDRGSVLVSASRRTPDEIRGALAQRFSQVPGLVWSGTGAGPNPYAGMLGWADRIVCSADSVNMLSEACATNVPVFVAGARQVDGRPKRFVDSLLGRDRVRPLDETLATYGVSPLRETARVAAEVQVRLARPGQPATAQATPSPRLRGA